MFILVWVEGSFFFSENESFQFPVWFCVQDWPNDTLEVLHQCTCMYMCVVLIYHWHLLDL